MPTADPFERFSSGYVFIDGADVRCWTEDIAAVPVEMYEHLTRHFGEPLIGYIGGRHYQLAYRTYGIPANTVAVPKSDHKSNSPDSLLIQH